MGVRKRKIQRKKFRMSAKRRQRSHKKKLNPTIEVPEMQKKWNTKKSAPANFDEMGLVYNLNKIKPSKEELKNIDMMEKYETHEEVGETSSRKKEKKAVGDPTIADQMEAAVKRRKSKQVIGGIRLPKDLIDFATMMLDKHGHDFKAMARDPINIYQDSWKQIRTKVIRFVTNPRYFAPYLKERNRLHLPALPSEEAMLKNSD